MVLVCHHEPDSKMNYADPNCNSEPYHYLRLNLSSVGCTGYHSSEIIS